MGERKIKKPESGNIIMNKFGKNSRLVKILLLLLPVIVAALFAADLIYINHFNSIVHETKGDAEDELTHFSLDNRDDTTSGWLKREFELDGEIVDLSAQTFDGRLYNNASYEVSTWSFTLRIKSDCMINQMWCGTAEIHQHVGTVEEKVQTLDLRYYDVDDVTLDYYYDGDLLIPLSAGDYIVYYPSETEELPLEGGSVETIGCIFYYLDMPDLSDYTMSYQYRRSYTDCILFRIARAVAFVWLLLLAGYIVARVSYQTAVREMEMKKSGISAMSEIYSIIYIVDLKKNELIPIDADKESEKLRGITHSAEQQFRSLFEADSTELYRDSVRDFCDLSTIRERIRGKNTLVLEYVSRTHGWCRLRFFAMDRGAQKDPDKLIFTIRVIEEEKAQLEALHQAVREKTENIIDIQQKVVIGLANIIENRDDNTGGHVKRTSDVIDIIVSEIQRQGRISLDSVFAGDIVRAAPMHDLGKISIDSSILCKPGRLTQEEFEIMKTHAAKSGEMVRLLLNGVEEAHFVTTAFNIARYHHERWDGSGYPDHLQGDSIPIEARIMAIADVYDALVCKRCYKEAFSFEKAYDIMMEGMGTQFDPAMKDVFESCHGALEAYYMKNQ